MFLNEISTSDLAGYSGLSRRHITALRFGRNSPTLDAMKWIAGGMSDIVGSRVRLSELFDLAYPLYRDEATEVIRRE